VPVFYRLLDDNRQLFVPELQETINPHPHFMLFATQNPPGKESALLCFVTNATPKKSTCTVLLHAWMQCSHSKERLYWCATFRHPLHGTGHLWCCNVMKLCVLHYDSSNVFAGMPQYAVLLTHACMCTIIIVKINAVILTFGKAENIKLIGLFL